MVSLEDATPVIDNNSSGGDLTREDRVYTLTPPTIPPEVTPIFTGTGDTALFAGTQAIQIPKQPRAPKKFYWIQE
jgi:hypothetical protein